MKNTTIDTSLMPHIYLNWQTSNGNIYLDCATGEKLNEFPDGARFGRYCGAKMLLPSGSKTRFGYAKYHEDIERMEFAEVAINTTRKGEVKEWRYVGDKYFLGKDKSVVDENGNVITSHFNLSRYHVARDFKDFLSMFQRIQVYSNVSEFKKFLGSDTYIVGSGRVVEPRYAWHIQEWYRTTQKVRGQGKQQKLTNKLVEMEVNDVTDIVLNKLKEMCGVSGYRRYYYNNKVMLYERLGDGWSVLRCFRQTEENEAREFERMYLNDDGSNRIVMPSKDGWVPAKQSNSYGTFKFINMYEAMEQCDRLKYIIPALCDQVDSSFKNCLVSILRFPVLEQLIGIGYKKLAIRIAQSITPRADIANAFGGYYNEKQKSLYKKVGMNRHQFTTHMNAMYEDGRYWSRTSATLKEMRKTFGENLIHLDNATFDKYYNAFISMQNGYRRNIFPQLTYLGIDREKFIKNAIRLGEKHPNVYSVLNDTLDQYTRLNFGTAPEIEWMFDSYSDVVRAHDAIDELKRAQDAERRAMWNMAEAERRKKEEAKRIKLDEERKEWEYEDDNYVIRLPKDLGEIVSEGSKQRICIGSYTSRHALGETNLFFLRRKNEPETPFYAIEVNRYKEIVQIHGYCNKWLGNDPDAIPTVVRWLRKNEFKCKEQILTCTSRGYSSVNHYVAMPVVD